MSKLSIKFNSFFTSLSRRVMWSLPKNQSIVILNEGGSEFLINSLESTEYFILKKRNNIYLKYLLAAIFMDRKFNIQELSYCYNFRMLDRLNPKLIITNVDNCSLHMRLDKERKIGHFLTVQNGIHWVNRPPELPARFRNLFIESSSYYSHFASISAFDIDYYLKNGVTIENYYPIGSIHASQRSIDGFFKKKTKKYDLCLVTNSINSRPENIKLWNYVIDYIETHNVSACLALKKSRVSHGYNQHIKGLEKIFDSPKVEIVYREKDSSQYASDISEVTIGAFSTLLRQTFARGNKIYPVNFGHSALSPPYDLLGYPLNPTYKEFESHLDFLLNADEEEYCERYKKLMKYFDALSPTDPPNKKLEKIIHKLLSDS
jgi:hypothetical protein